ncbi:MAG TPA: hypothetical protein VM055_04360 [Novosphingobium sp.]|nr:hypothetical protein [Novosphingobium sp.]
MLASIAASLTAGCATPPTPGAALLGNWGGEHIGLELTPTGGRLAYDCAAGTIDGPLAPDRGGRFAASGTHSPGHGGPDRIGEAPPRYRANYAGTIAGGAMELRIAVPDRDTTLGPFRLRKDAAPRLMRCL